MPKPSVRGSEGVPSRRASEPPETGWDEPDAVDLPSSAVIAAADEVRASSPPPPLPPAMRSSPDLGRDEAPIARRARSSPDLADAAARSPVPPPVATPRVRVRGTEPTPVVPPAVTTERDVVDSSALPLELQEQLFGLVKAALDATLTPLLAKQSELETRLHVLREAEERAAFARAAQSAVSSPARTAAPAESAKVPPEPKSEPESQRMTQPAVRPSIVATSYGLVMEQPSAARRPDIDLELANVAPFDVPDFGSGRRAGRLLLALLLAGVVAAIAATFLSYT